MLKFRFTLVTFLLVISNPGVVAQTTHGLILPEDIHGTVKLNLWNIPNSNGEELGYDNLSVHVKNEQEDYASNAVQGQYGIEGNYLQFKPYFPFERGMTYVVRIMTLDSDRTYSFQPFQLGKKKKFDKAKVESIYPSAGQLPENLLRFYIYFNTPMKKGQALNHIKLLDEEGNMDNHAFMEFKQELWSADGKRLTLLFDPGRIKRGVSTNIRKGPALLEGKRYRLTISAAWQDVYGQELSVGTTKEVEVINGYRHHLKVRNLALEKPKANSYDVLTLFFDRIMDHALIRSMIKVNDANDNHIIGYWEVADEERTLRFIPRKKWKKGHYRIVVDSRLEDIAGNNLQNLLDHIKTDKESNGKSYSYIEFRI